MTRPNILFLFTDQLRADAIGAAGNPIIKTPNLDRIAREGVLFDSAYSPSPVCVPARGCLAYGQYTDKTGCFWNPDPMPEDGRNSFMGSLTQAGYRTHGIGKMHFMPDAHAMRGFETRERQEEILGTVEEDEYLPWLHEQGYSYVRDPHGVRGPMYYIPQVAQMPAECHPTQWIGDRCVDFIENYDNSSDKPFMLWGSFIHPHPPFSPPNPWHRLYEPSLMPLPKRPTDMENLHVYINRVQNRYKWRDQGIDDQMLKVQKAHYYACVSFIDYQVGRMLDSLEKTGQLDNTLIVFTSDHGEFLGDYNCFGKRAMLDSASNIPMLARMPGRFDGGKVCSTPVSLVDVFPTLLAAADAKDDSADLDGCDMAEVAAGQHSGRAVFSQYQHREVSIHMMVNKDYKYIYSAADNREFLFDRVCDRAETRNRAETPVMAGTTAEMRSGIIDHYKSRNHTQELDGDNWKVFDPPAFPADPDAMLLRQDAPWSIESSKLPGYNC